MRSRACAPRGGIPRPAEWLMRLFSSATASRVAAPRSPPLLPHESGFLPRRVAESSFSSSSFSSSQLHLGSPLDPHYPHPFRGCPGCGSPRTYCLPRPSQLYLLCRAVVAAAGSLALRRAGARLMSRLLAGILPRPFRGRLAPEGVVLSVPRYLE